MLMNVMIPGIRAHHLTTYVLVNMDIRKTEINEISDDSDTEMKEVYKSIPNKYVKEYPFQDICTWINNLK